MPAPEARCVVDDPRLAELSGLAADQGGLWALADGGRRVQVHRIDPVECRIVESRTADIDPVDPEDLAHGRGGTLWVGDIGDNDRDRTTIAVIELPARGEARLHRLTYPDGPHDAEALLLDADGRPIVVTKDAGPAGIYRAETRPDGLGPTPLVRIGQVVLPASDTVGGPLSGLGSRVVTGAGVSADGRVVALRSYTDAWLYPVPENGDVAAALAGRPMRVPLPAQPQGEAITFEADGTLLSGSETRGGVPAEIRAVPGVAGLVAGVGEPTDQLDPGAGGGVAAVGPEPQRPMPEWMPAAIGAGAFGGLLVLVMLALAVRAARRR